MGIGPLVAWRRASLRSLGLTFAWPAGVALLVGLVLLALGAGSSIPGLIAYTFSAFVLALDRARVRPRHARPPRALRRLLAGRLLRRSSPATAAATAATSSTPRSSCSRSGSPARAPTTRSASGGSRRASRSRSATTRLTYRGLEEREAANATEIRAVLDVERGGDALGTIEAGKNAYTAERQVSNEVGIRSDLLTGEDLFVIAEQVNADGTVYFRVFVKPLVNLIWLAGLVFLLGSLITLWPDAREQRRLADALRAAPRRRRDRERRARPRRAARRGLRRPRGAAVPARAGGRPGRARRAGRARPAPAGARRGARPGARGAEGARVRPPHRQGLGRGLPGARRPAAPRGRRGAARARAAGGCAARV